MGSYDGGRESTDSNASRLRFCRVSKNVHEIAAVCSQMKDGSVLVVSARAARGMAHQDLTKVWGVAPCLLDGIKVGEGTPRSKYTSMPRFYFKSLIYNIYCIYMFARGVL